MAKKKVVDTNTMSMHEKISEKKDSAIKSSQPEINIGMFGHVDHGKTTLVKCLSGRWTDTHSEEMKRGITIKLGYADVAIYKCPSCKDFSAFSTNEKCPKCKGLTIFQRKVSLVDAPGHESLMATMLAGAMIIDGAFLLISAAEQCPQPQTREHIMALQMLGVENMIVVQNKIDMVNAEQAAKNYEQIKTLLATTRYKDATIIPISGQYHINIDVLISAVQDLFKTPVRDPNADPIMFVARTFDINKPGTDPEKVLGGVLGGAIIQGKLSVGQEIEIRPGREFEEKNKKVWKPLITKIIGLMTGGEKVDHVVPGGSIAVLTNLDPFVVKSDKLTGNTVGIPGKLPPIWYDLLLDPHLLDRVVGVNTDAAVDPIKLSEPLMLNVNAAATVGVVTDLSKNQVKCALKLPVCAEKGSRVTISRRIGNRFRLIGYGIIK